MSCGPYLLCVYILFDLAPNRTESTDANRNPPTMCIGRLYVILPDRIKNRPPTRPPTDTTTPTSLLLRRRRQPSTTTATLRLRTAPAKTLVVLGSGGHTKEMLTMLRGLDPERYRPAVFVRADVRRLCLSSRRAFDADIQDNDFRHPTPSHSEHPHARSPTPAATGWSRQPPPPAPSSAPTRRSPCPAPAPWGSPGSPRHLPPCTPCWPLSVSSFGSAPT